MKMLANDKPEELLLEMFEQCAYFEEKFPNEIILAFVKEYVRSASDNALFSDLYSARELYRKDSWGEIVAFYSVTF